MKQTSKKNINKLEAFRINRKTDQMEIIQKLWQIFDYLFIITSTRRFAALPVSVVLSSIGFELPKPL